VRVLEVDMARKRISLTMKLDAPVGAKQGSGAGRDNSFRPAARHERPSGGRGHSDQAGQSSSQSAMAAAFAKLQTKR